MKTCFFNAAALASMLAAAGKPTAGDAVRRHSPAAFSSMASAQSRPPRCTSSGGRGDRRQRGTSSRRPLVSRSHTPTRPGGWRGNDGVRPAGSNTAVAAPGSAASASAGCGQYAAASATAWSGLTGSKNWRWGWRIRGRRRWVQDGGKQQRGRFAGPAGVRAGRVRLAAAAAASLSSSAGGAEGGEGEEDRCIRRLDTAVRRVFADYYSCTDVRETTGSLGVFLKEATAALELPGPLSLSADTGADTSIMSRAACLAARLKARLLESSERLNYHLDGDDPMVLYRFWMRGRAIDVYERDLLCCPRWIELVAETKRQVEDAPVYVESDTGTICYPSGEIFEGKVDSLIRSAKAGTTPPPSSSAVSFPSRGGTSAKAFADAEMSSGETAGGVGDGDGDDGGIGSGSAAANYVQTVSGLVSLTIGCLEDGLSDEAIVLRRHFCSPDFGHPLLRLASPSGNDPDYPHIPDDPELDPDLLRAEEELTEEHIALGERGAKELIHDRRRAQLDVYLVCAAYRGYLPTPASAVNVVGDAAWDGRNLHQDDAQLLDELLRRAAAESLTY